MSKHRADRAPQDVEEPRRQHVLVRVTRFLLERFPPVPQLVLMSTIFVAGTLMSGVLLAPAIGGALGDIDVARAVAAFAGALIFIVRLRVYDDVKDADTDRIENPTRPIPRGLVSVRELDVTGVALLLVEAALLYLVGTTSFLLWLIAAAWSVLMRVEFFVPAWLDRHPATFAISHMAALGLIFGMLLGIGIDVRGGDASLGDLLASGKVWGAIIAATLLGIGFEWGRKFERYFDAHGERAWTLWMLWPCLGAMGFTLLVRDDYPTWTLATLAAVAIFTIAGHALIMGQRSHPTEPGGRGEVPVAHVRAAVEAAPGLAGLILYAVIAAAGIADVAGG